MPKSYACVLFGSCANKEIEGPKVNCCDCGERVHGPRVGKVACSSVVNGRVICGQCNEDRSPSSGSVSSGGIEIVEVTNKRKTVELEREGGYDDGGYDDGGGKVKASDGTQSASVAPMNKASAAPMNKRLKQRDLEKENGTLLTLRKNSE